MIGRQRDELAVDVLAVRADDELLDRIASRDPREPRDPAIRLLAALAAEVDDGLVQRLATAVTEPRGAVRGRRTAHGAALALVLGATLSVGGVAAAVTGDPLAPYRAVEAALPWGGDELPATAADIGRLGKRLSRERSAIVHGEVSGARGRLDALRTGLAELDLRPGQRAAFERRIDRLRSAKEHANANGTASADKIKDRTGRPGRQGAAGSKAGGPASQQDTSAANTGPSSKKPGKPDHAGAERKAGPSDSPGKVKGRKKG